MPKVMLDLIELIKQGAPIEKISSEMNLSYSKIYHLVTMLKNKGFVLNRKYYYNGDLHYLLNHNNNCNTLDVDLYTFDTDEEFRAVLISDLHLGSKLDDIRYINMVFDYCKNNGINIIISGGDFIDGNFGGEKRVDNIYDQIEYALHNYPQDKEIITFTVLGDHDNTISDFGIDFSEVLNSRRHDIVPLGYQKGAINIKNETILVKHPYPCNVHNEGFNTTELKVSPEAIGLILEGHGHCLKFTKNTSPLKIFLPSLSNIQFHNGLPAFVDMTISMKRGYFTIGNFRVKGIVDGKIVNIVENQFPLYRKGTPDKKSPIEEIKPKVRKKSQIEKFNDKYNM